MQLVVLGFKSFATTGKVRRCLPEISRLEYQSLQGTESAASLRAASVWGQEHCRFLAILCMNGQVRFRAEIRSKIPDDTPSGF